MNRKERILEGRRSLWKESELFHVVKGKEDERVRLAPHSLLFTTTFSFRVYLLHSKTHKSNIEKNQRKQEKSLKLSQYQVHGREEEAKPHLEKTSQAMLMFLHGCKRCQEKYFDCKMP